MPASEHPDENEHGHEIDSLLDRLSAAAGNVAERFEAVVERATKCEAEYEKLRLAMQGSGDSPLPANAEERLAQLNDENRQLRSIVEEARARADRIRNRLAVVEDEL
jgi:DNA-binding ferritin-like protein